MKKTLLITFLLALVFSNLTFADSIENAMPENSLEKFTEVSFNLEDPLIEQLSWGVNNTYVTTYGPWSGEYVAKDVFVTSVAKGQSTTLTSEFKSSLNASVSGSPYVPVSISGSVTASYSTSHTFVGPPEGSIYNSREFRCEFMARQSTWRQEWYMDGVLVGVRTGIRVQPLSYHTRSIYHIR